MRIWLFIVLSILALGCQKQKNIIWVEEDPTFIVDKKGNIFNNKEWNKITHDPQQNYDAQISFQSNRLVINFENKTSLIFKPKESSCEERINEKFIDECSEEFFLAAICKDEEVNTLICANDTFFWEFSMQLSHNKEHLDSTCFKIRKLKNTKKVSHGKLVLHENEFKSYF